MNPSPNPPTQLNQNTLPDLDPSIRRPRYNRAELQQHTVHLGVGGFHRAHQAVYLDDLLAMPHTTRWGECGLGVLDIDIRMRNALRGQDFLYTVVERSAAKQNARVIGSMVNYVYAPEDRQAAIEQMADPQTRIVSLTITEGGYFLDGATGKFLTEHPSIQSDLRDPAHPVTSIGLIAEALDRRRKRGLAPFTVMSCDNLQGNGHVVRNVLLAYAGMHNTQLASWAEHNVAFPNSMVDRITPATTPSDIAFLADRFALQDAWPVVTEPFRQWVIEDTFCNGRPAWEEVGAKLVHDVAAYEIMKMRLLNGSHLAMAYLGALHGFIFVHNILANPLFRSFIERFMEEVTPVVPSIPGVSISEYKATLMDRFSNPTINDQVTRICSEGSAKMPKWLLPSITELLQQRRCTDLLTLVVASWIHYFQRGIDEFGKPLDIIDARSAELIAAATTGGADRRPILAIRNIFGESLSEDERFVRAVADALGMLSKQGTLATVHHYLGSQNS